MIDRRSVLKAGGGIAALLPLIPAFSWAQDVVEITMGGKGQGAHVWFDPIGILIEPGQTVRWTNRDNANSHTATAYHPENYDRPMRMPEAARPFDSDFLLPGDSFSVTLTEPGVYDYYCIPHERAGMVGRIVVSAPIDGGWIGSEENGDLADIALRSFPSIDEIMAKGVVRRT